MHTEGLEAKKDVLVWLLGHLSRDCDLNCRVWEEGQRWVDFEAVSTGLEPRLEERLDVGGEGGDEVVP